MKALARTLRATALLLGVSTLSYAGQVDVVGSFPSPLPYPRFGLDFDTTTGTLWGIDNFDARPNIMNFDLSGNLIQGFTGVSSWNSLGIAVDPVGGRIYYWQNLALSLRQASYPYGAFLGSTEFPFGYQNAVNSIDFDPVLNRIVLAKKPVFSPSQGIDIRPGFDFVVPGGGIDFSVEFDVMGVADFSAVLGLVVTEDSYWLLGSSLLHNYDQIVRVSRATGQLVDRFVLPDSRRQTYRGLAHDPATGLFYSNFADQGVRVLRLTPAAGAVVSVRIDVKPDSVPNSINPRSAGLIPVALVTTRTFDATTVDALTVTFGPLGASEAHRTRHIEDVDRDGDLDLVLHFRTRLTGIACGARSASLRGKTVSGQEIAGSDSIWTVGCK